MQSLNNAINALPEHLRNDAQDKDWFGGSEQSVSFGSSTATFGPQTIEELLAQDGLSAQKLIRPIRKIPGTRRSMLSSRTVGGRHDTFAVVGMKDLLDKIRLRSNDGTEVCLVCTEPMNPESPSADKAIGSRVLSLDVDFSKTPEGESLTPVNFKEAERAILLLEQVFGLVSPTHLVYSSGAIRACWITPEPISERTWETLAAKLFDLAARAEVISAAKPLPKIDAPYTAPTTGKSKRPLNTHRLIKAGDLIPLIDLVESIEGRHAALCAGRPLTPFRLTPPDAVEPNSEEAVAIAALADMRNAGQLDRITRCDSIRTAPLDQLSAELEIQS